MAKADVDVKRLPRRNASERAWFAVHTAPLKERLVTMLLTDQGIDVFWPHYLAQVRQGTRRGYSFRSWFPRYLFVGDGQFYSAGAVNSTMGVSTLVYIGEEPLSIPFDLILEMKRIADPSGLIMRSKLAPDHMVPIKGDNLIECIKQLSGFKKKVWAEGLMSTVKAA